MFQLSCLFRLLCLFTTLVVSFNPQTAMAVPPDSSPSTQQESTPSKPLRVLCFGAHPDDSEIRAAGCAILWARRGDKVHFVSATNGDIGHWKISGKPLAKRRLAEVQQAARMLGVKTTVLDNHDGELEPTLENRRILTRLIREWKADVVIGHRTNDYHPDHRYAGILMQDSAFMVTVPFFCPETPYLTENPVFLYSSDAFKQPAPFVPDVVVSIDEVINQKLDALMVMESQFLEGGALGYRKPFPVDADARKAARQESRAGFERRFFWIGGRIPRKVDQNLRRGSRPKS